MPTLSEDLRFRGLVHQVTDDRLWDRLDNDRLTLYIGFDPSFSSLHIGSLLQLALLRRFQRAGHRPIALAGGGTGMIGDPGGKTDERQLLSREMLAANVEAIRNQLARFVDLEDGLLLDNGAWLAELSMIEFLRDVGKHFTVNQMMAKESVKARLERPDQGISYTEFSYMLLQAYDFLRLHEDYGCELQVGGRDQWGNITAGVDFVRKLSTKPVHGMTTPLVVKADGTKFGKTASGAVWLDPALTSPFRLYQFLLQAEDAVVGAWLRYLTFLDHATLEELDRQTAEHPERRAAQHALGIEVTRLVHGEIEAAHAVRTSRALFGEEIASLDEQTLLDVVGDAPSSMVERDALVRAEVRLVDVLVSAGLVASRSEARRAITQGGAYVNNRRVQDEGYELGPADLLHDRYVVLRRGRRDHHLLVAR
ncbi:MAG TPA: tyrosine--tRNA ligase [Acidimicrobiales bacterium]|nr:tyrosine--tRNA ligase [Acidimicrobiales bacterium]